MRGHNGWMMAAAAVWALGCVSVRTDDGRFGGEDDSASGPDGTGAASTASSGPGDGGPGGDSGGPGPDPDDVIYDVGDGQATAEGGIGGPGCDKADFLFIVDNSGSMQDEQQNLIASFPGFISTIKDSLKAQDYHIMVVDTDASGGSWSTSSCVNGVCSCSPAPACCDSICMTNSECNGVPCGMISDHPCNGTVGAGKIHREDGTICLDEAGPRYMTEATPDVATAFSCVAEVGTFGSGSEVPMESMMEATSAALNGAGACNDGFLRDDAILVVTFITDEEDDGDSVDGPAAWAQALIDAKGGNDEAVVVLGLCGDPSQPIVGCDAEPAPRLADFIERFGPRGFAGSICEPDFTPFFIDAVQIIDLTCDEFVPEG